MQYLVESHDIVKKEDAVEEINATLSYTKDDKANTFNVHTTYQLLCVDNPEFKNYLLNCFREFFHIQRAFYRRLDEAANKRRKE